MYSVIDLFAGAGGLSLGFCQTKKFEIKAAFEKNQNAQKTYIKNHPYTEMFDDVCKADYSAIIKKYGEIDIVIGGPPCQGFSNANRQKNHAVSQNNMLVKQYVRAILELQPKAFVMENVSMLKSDVHRFYMSEDDQHITEMFNIPTEETELILLDKVYNDLPLLELVQNQDLIKKYLWEEDDYLLLNIVYRQKNNETKCSDALKKYKKKLITLSERLSLMSDNQDSILNLNSNIYKAIMKYYTGESTISDVVNEFEKIILIQRMLSKAKEVFDNKIIVNRYNSDGKISVFIKSFAVFDYLNCILGSDTYGYKLKSDVLCAADYGAPQKRMRFVIIGIKKSISDEVSLPTPYLNADKYTTVRDAILDLAGITPITDISSDNGTILDNSNIKLSALGSKLRDTEILYNHVITATRETAMKRFAALKPGENFHSLDSSMKEDTYTDISRTQNTIYLRLNYDEPSGTVVNVRKSMWIHPELNRAVSIREAARLQTFPDSFVFEGTKDSQYQQVGNAVPPMLANAIAQKIVELLDKSNNISK